MRHFLSKPYNWSLFAMLILLAWPFTPPSIDMHIADTYFVVSRNYFFIPIAAVTLMLWMLYRFTNSLMYSNTLTAISVALILIFFALFFYIWFMAVTHGVADTGVLVPVAVYLMLAAQLVFIANLLMGVIKGKR